MLELLFIILLFPSFICSQLSETELIILNGSNAHAAYAPKTSLDTLSYLSLGFYGSEDYVSLLESANFALLPNSSHSQTLKRDTTLIIPSVFTCVDFLPTNCVKNSLQFLQSRSFLDQQKWELSANAWTVVNNSINGMNIPLDSIGLELTESQHYIAPCSLNLTIKNYALWDLVDPTIHQEYGVYLSPEVILSGRTGQFFTSKNHNRGGTKGVLTYKIKDQNYSLSFVWEVKQDSSVFPNKIGVQLSREPWATSDLLSRAYQNHDNVITDWETSATIQINEEIEAKITLSSSNEATALIVLQKKILSQLPPIPDDNYRIFIHQRQGYPKQSIFLSNHTLRQSYDYTNFLPRKFTFTHNIARPDYYTIQIEGKSLRVSEENNHQILASENQTETSLWKVTRLNNLYATIQGSNGLCWSSSPMIRSNPLTGDLSILSPVELHICNENEDNQWFVLDPVY